MPVVYKQTALGKRTDIKRFIGQTISPKCTDHQECDLSNACAANIFGEQVNSSREPGHNEWNCSISVCNCVITSGKCRPVRPICLLHMHHHIHKIAKNKPDSTSAPVRK